MKLSGGKWKRTVLCGCGECRNVEGKGDGYKCPMESAPGAKWLFASDYSFSEEELEEAAKSEMDGDVVLPSPEDYTYTPVKVVDKTGAPF